MAKKIEEQASEEVLTAAEMPQEAEAVEEAAQAPQEEQAADPIASLCKTVVVQAEGGLNLRCGPGKEFAIGLVLPDGTALTVIPTPYGAYAPGWLPVLAPGFRLGWVDERYVEAVTVSEEG